MNENELQPNTTPTAKEDNGPKNLAAIVPLFEGSGNNRKMYNLVCIAEFEYVKEAYEQDVTGANTEAMQETKEEAIAAGNVTENGTPIFTGEDVLQNVKERILEFSSYAFQKVVMRTISDFNKTPAAQATGNGLFEQAIQFVKDRIRSEFTGGSKPRLLKAQVAIVDPDKGRPIYGDQELLDSVNTNFDPSKMEEKKETANIAFGEKADKIKKIADDFTSGKNKTVNNILTVVIFIFIAIIVVVALLKK